MKTADIYGSGMGPAHETAVGEASGPASGLKPAYFWVGMILILILARMVYEYAE